MIDCSYEYHNTYYVVALLNLHQPNRRHRHLKQKYINVRENRRGNQI